MVIKSNTWCSKLYALRLTCFCVFQYGDLPIFTALLVVVSKSICSAMLDDSRKKTDTLLNSSWSISGTTCSTCSENSERFVGDSVGKTKVVNEGINCS